jgi:hypothetical protein
MGEFATGRMRWCAIVLAARVVALGLPSAAPAGVLLVGSFHGIAGDYTSLQAAVDAAHPGDWILVGPGDHKESGNQVPVGAAGDDEAGAAVLVTTPDVRIRGMNRNTVVIDGTRAGAPQCSAAAGDQDLGALDPSGSPMGRNGIVAYKASGSYLNATSTYFGGADGPLASYGVYASNVYGPGTITKAYANNMGDSGLYVGACPDCNVTLDHTHAEFNDVGYSGTNSGGHLVIENSEFDENQSGVVTNSANNDDAPSPQDGACPNGETGPTGSGSCWLFEHNYVHDNNNANAPSFGFAALAPVGTGVVIAGGRNDVRQPDERRSRRGVKPRGPGQLLVRQSAPGRTGPAEHGACAAQLTHGLCGIPNVGAALVSPLGLNVICDSQFLAMLIPGVSCPTVPSLLGLPGLFNYPRPTRVVMPALPAQPTMTNPCSGVPADPWCRKASRSARSDRP